MLIEDFLAREVVGDAGGGPESGAPPAAGGPL
jgi:hypothetical protein